MLWIIIRKIIYKHFYLNVIFGSHSGLWMCAMILIMCDQVQESAKNSVLWETTELLKIVVGI